MIEDPRHVPFRPPNRPPIKHGFLHYAAEWFIRKVGVERDPEVLAELWQFIDHADVDGDDTRERGTRVDLLISICRAVYCTLARCQVKSLRVGRNHQSRGPNGEKHDMVGLARAAVAEWSGRSERTVSMVYTLLRRAGLVHGPSRSDRANWIKQPCERDAGGSVEWLPAVRRISFLFFSGLGLGAWLAELRQGKPKPAPGPEKGVATVSNASFVKLAHELGLLLSVVPDG